MSAVPDVLEDSLAGVEAAVDRLLTGDLDRVALHEVKARLGTLVHRLAAAELQPVDLAIRDPQLVVQRLAEHGADHGIDEILRARGAKSEDELRGMIRTGSEELRAYADDPRVPALGDPQEMLDDVVERSGGRPALYGLTSSLPIEILVSMAQTNPKPGRLWIRTATEVLWFDVRDGRIARACSAGPETEGERLGELVVAMGLLGPDEIRALLDGAQRRGVPLGVQLLEHKAITAEMLREALRKQSLSRFSRALRAPRAAYAFAVATESDAAAPDNIGFDGRHLLLECARHRDEWKRPVIRRRRRD